MARSTRTRPPTRVELACAFSYIEVEYVLHDGSVDGEQWAEGLAFARIRPGPCEYFGPTAWDYRVADEVLPQFTSEQWCTITARADYLRADQGMARWFSDVPDVGLG